MYPIHKQLLLSIVYCREELPLPLPRQQKQPPVAMKRNKSNSSVTSVETLQPSISSQEGKTPRRYTVGGAVLGQGGGSNAQLLAQAASARIKLRATGKSSENVSSSEEKQTTSTPNEKPAWMAALKVCIINGGCIGWVGYVLDHYISIYYRKNKVTAVYPVLMKLTRYIHVYIH